MGRTWAGDPCLRRGRRGTVLIVVLVLVLMMSVAAYGFVLSMQTENIAARASGDRLTAEQAAFSGVELLSAVLELPRHLRAELGGIADNPSLFSGVAAEDESQADQDHRPQFMVIASSSLSAQTMPVRFGAVDESAKLHLAKLVEWDQLEPDSGRDALLRLPGLTPDVADAILDWIDPDSQPRFEGAESDAYAAASTPTTPRNGTPIDLEELLLVRGVKQSLLFGTTRNLDRGLQLDNAAGPPHWSRFLTVYSGERNEAVDGRRRVYLNVNDVATLHQQLAARMPIAWANFIVLYRQYGPGIASGPSLAAEQFPLDLTKPATRRIASPLDLIDATIAVRHNGKSAQINSPFSSEPLMMRDQLGMLLDQVSVSNDAVIEGRVNINSAPREVLLAVPGIDESLAEQILAARSMIGQHGQSRSSVAWPLVEGLVDLDTQRRLLPHINVGGDVVRAEFWGRVAPKATQYRCEVVIDGTRLPARQVYFRELPPAAGQQYDDRSM